MIAMHPQACSGQPDALRWVTGPDVVPFVGEVARAPEPLEALVDDVTVAEIRLEPAAVVVRLGPGRSWADDGPRVRTALHAALEQPGGWAPAGPPDAGPSADDVLRAAAQRVVDESAGPFARSHGGRIELLDVQDGVVRVRLGGACHGCPAARTTMRVRLEEVLRRECSGPVRVVAADGA